MSYNRLGDLGAIALGTGLAVNDSLKELNLGIFTINRIYSHIYLKFNICFFFFFVAWNQIRSKGIAGLLNGLKVCKKFAI